MSTQQYDYLPLAIQLLVALGFVVMSVGVTHLKDVIFPKIDTKSKGLSFESGVKSYGNARIPFSVKYFLVALLFVLFDVEVIFMYPWAVNFREMGMEGLLKMLLFISLLLIGFYYVIKKKALEWE